MPKKKRVYELYTWGVGHPITNQTRGYKTGMWILDVRAVSIKQAYYLVAIKQVAVGKGLGIVAARNSYNAPSNNTPWGITGLDKVETPGHDSRWGDRRLWLRIRLAPVQRIAEQVAANATQLALF